jgi:hypothetical protein
VPLKIRNTAEFLFVESVASGIVHIEVRYASYDDPFTEARGGQQPEKVSFAEGMHSMLYGPHIVLCGAKTYPVAEKTHHYTNCFPDEKLCANCHRRLHPDDVERAFQHPQPDGSEEG